MLLHVDQVNKSYRAGQRILKNINLTVGKGEIVGLVGESGSGKSTLAKIIMQLEKPEKGDLFFEDQLMTKQNRSYFYENCQIIFQNATAALNPVWTVRELLHEPIQAAHKSFTDRELQTMLEMVKLPSDILEALPSELSGGERQRVNLLRSILVEPQLLVCDEIVSSLDRLIQREIIDLLMTLNKEKNMAILFISHDLKAVSYLCNRIYVMKSGEIVDESRKCEDGFAFTDKYAQMLFQAVENE
ncbi:MULTISPECIES: ABC transporter ATP-binding protein [Lysinibacillus]|uniref:ABC transporter ATP-binding protein n=1 Tax=Lysinibacillus TaxID=400634 RepID=UPI0005030F52|nr:MULTISPECIES: dipeptide/oligopeptide/nickel ABC transporter ATP-binding protein [Lysinibacillus]KAB0442628.1 ABC transporter ATP-binding protein [Lysinibacillus fusiformis]KGA83892.1 peptide ABC transporter ATP-binding protein [Lysinibacillus fusiformis]MCK1987967.1 dipeptide/oligopeptide/nickel ABC transporter ATP-binding protein [Lysinibacillus fusiformis]UXJ70903.1 dipeptide/oligopeptide/nickel ABC transporter ATP-binding protein [Lysinibacillus fusiformis]